MNEQLKSNLDRGLSLWGRSVITNSQSGLQEYQYVIRRKFDSRYEEELAEQIRVSLPFTAEIIPNYLTNLSPYDPVEMLFQRMTDEMFHRVPVIEIDGPRAAGKTMQTQKLLNYLINQGKQATLSKGAGFIDGPDEIISFLNAYPYLDPELKNRIWSSRFTRWANRQEIFTLENQNKPYSKFKPMARDMTEILTEMVGPDWQNKPIYEVLSDLHHNVHEDRRLLGEDVWFMLQDILIAHLNHNYQKAQPIICDTGRISRVLNHSRYDRPTASHNNPFMMGFPFPETWFSSIKAETRSFHSEILLPLPRMTIVLQADKDYLVNKARTDNEKPEDEIKWRMDSIYRNYDLFYQTAMRYLTDFPDNTAIVKVGEDSSPDQTHEQIVTLLFDRGIF